MAKKEEQEKQVLEQLEATKNKYISMAKNRSDFNNINPEKFLLPDLDEMIQEDLMMEINEQYVNNDTGGDYKEEDILNSAFYKEAPFATNPGHYSEEGAFVLKVSTPHNIPESTWELNKFDGDTWSFNLDDINDGNQPIMFTDGPESIKYRNFKDFFKKMGGGSAVQVRALGIDAMEIPHYEVQVSPKEIYSKSVKKVKWKDVKEMLNGKNFITYENFIYDKNTGKATERKDDDDVTLYYLGDKEGKSYYTEIITRMNAKDYISETKDDYEYFVVMGKNDESKSNTIKDAYDAQLASKEMLSGADEIILVLNANGIKASKPSTDDSKTFNSVYYLKDTVDYMIEQWGIYYGDLPVTNYNYLPYGMDNYKRSLGVVYVRKGKDWVNLNKYVLAKTKDTIANPSFNSSPELQAIGSGISDSFNLWSYDKNNIEWLDSYNKISQKSYQDRIDLHKKITGIDFLKVRNCALFIGDTLMLIPPESIRNITQVYYEKIPNMRSKGTQAKNKGQNQQMLELSLYFYESSGINGIDYDYTTPNGTKFKYKMNGLRSLIAQFKIAPFLPIENGYINDVLGIEAVSLENLSIQTVEGLPRLIKAVLTVREFNYRTYMPDMPLDEDTGKDDNEKLAEMPPMFAKAFNWEIFRYYYQRSIMAGTNLSLLEFNSYDYNREFYGNKNCIGPWYFECQKSNKGTISFYIPDEKWLANALQIKKDRDEQLLTPSASITLSNEAEDYVSKLADLYKQLNDIVTYKNSSWNNAINNFFNPVKEGEYTLGVPYYLFDSTDKKTTKDITGAGKPSLDFSNDKNVSQPDKFTKERINTLVTALLDQTSIAGITKGITVDETKWIDKATDIIHLIWSFKIKLDLSTLSNEDWSNIKEIIGKDMGKDQPLTPDKMFIDDCCTIGYEMFFTQGLSHNIIMPDGPSENYKGTFVYVPSNDMKGLEGLMNNYINDGKNEENPKDDPVNQYNKEIDFYIRDYKNPANMPYVPYVRDILCTGASANISNTFTDISLKAIEGVGPQYIGGQDTQLEFSMITDDIVIVSLLNSLPALASSTAKTYRKIIPAWPIKIKSDITSLLGVSEVLIDSVDVSTLDGFPGIYSIRMRLTSVDRTQRQREALRRLDVKSEGGRVDFNGNSALSMRNYFNINNALSKVELYPDLDIPTLEELGKLGFRYVKYAGMERVYPDPDFYVVYAYPYTSLIIKKMVKDGLSKALFNVDMSDASQKFKFKDIYGSELTGKVEAYMGISMDSLDNDKSKTYFDIINGLNEQIKQKMRNMKNLTVNEKKTIEDRLDLAAAIKKLVLADVTDGWQIIPGWNAPLADKCIDEAILKISENNKDAFAQEIKDKRIKAVQLIDKILATEINFSSSKSDLKGNNKINYKQACINAVNNTFWENADGKELLQLLCPNVKLYKLEKRKNDSFSKDGFKLGDPMLFLAGFLFASGCAISGNREFASGIEEKDWHPNHLLSLADVPQKDESDTEYKGLSLPYCKTDKISGKSDVALSLKEGMDNGTVFGAWKIVKYSDQKVITNMVQKQSSIKYITDSDSAYEKVNPGFLDPFYNNGTSKDIYEYKARILLDVENNATAFLRNVLLFLRKMILDGLLISEIDVIASDWDKILEDLGYNEKWSGGLEYEGKAETVPLPGAAIPMSNPAIAAFMVKEQGEKEKDPSKIDSVTSGLHALGFNDEEMRKILEGVQIATKQSFCARLIYPFILAISGNANDLYELFKQRDYDSLNNLTGYVESEDSLDTSKISSLKFLSALSGINMTLIQDGKAEGAVSPGQKIINSMMKDIFIEASEDPRAYLLHSFYDMLTNDKRGRLARAFPTYYVVFIDEGRKFGSWKLHDNFYNMNAISEINIVKSRKIPADTCSFVMNNTFNSYAMEPDSTTTQQYADIYGLRDVFDSIFSPKKYFDKEKRIRNRQVIPDTVVLQPGIRIHVRMGYSGDGAKLPIVFNGKIAEVDITEVAQIVAQGDGHELTNPLNGFGEIEAVSLDAAQSMITWFKDFRGNWAKGGESPRDLIAKLLTAKNGGWRKAIDELSDGRWFNDNIFGIMHFGDPKYKYIFEQGEVVQNLYEVSDSNLLKNVIDNSDETLSNKSTPILNTSLQDKTFMDMLQLAANAGINYIGAVRDFGFRSTVFLGKPNHYYAYEYQLIDNKVIERRKPFQQFHYIDSYTDIIYNCIKASESQMKTNAVGLWQQSSKWWGREQATVGPIYVDMNIYPEYQRTMTVDTGLLAAGNGWIDLGITNNLSEEWALDPNDDKVNKATAWRVTANALKDSVKDMYLGDVGIIGDPSIKPYDRIYLHDTHEDMLGQFEVEAVIHSMSVNGGFTTSVMPDVIARHGDPFEASNTSLLSTVGAMLGFGVGLAIADKVNAWCVNGKLTKVIAKSKNMYGASKRLMDLAGGASNATGMKEFLEKRPTMKSLFESLNVFSSKDSLNLHGIDNAINSLSKIKPGSLNSMDDIAKALAHYSKIDVDEYVEALRSAYNKDSLGNAKDFSPEKVDEILNDIKKTKGELDGMLDYKNLQLDGFAEEVKKYATSNNEIYNNLSRESREILEKWSSKTYGEADDILKDLSKVLNEKEVLEGIKNNKIGVSHIDDFLSGFTKIFNAAEGEKGISIFAKAATKLKGGKLLNSLKIVAEGVIKLNPISLVADLVIETIIWIAINNAQEVFTRFLESVQAIDVYPMKKNNKPLIAGMNGHKGSVHGWPVKEGYDSIQGMIMQFINGIKKLDGDLPFADWVLDQFVDEQVLSNLSEEWRRELNIDIGDNQSEEDMLQTVYENVSTSYSANNQEAYAMMSKPRIKKPQDDNFSEDILNKYIVKDVTVQSLPNNTNVLKLNTLVNDPNIKAALIAGRFEIAHNVKNDMMITIPFESGTEVVPLKTDGKVIDLPLVSSELIWLLSKCLSEESVKDMKISFKSGLRANDVDGKWKATGYMMILEVKKSGDADNFASILDKYVDYTNIIKDSDGVFQYNRYGKKFIIMALAPKFGQ